MPMTQSSLNTKINTTHTEMNYDVADRLEELGYSVMWVDESGIMIHQAGVYLVNVREDVTMILGDLPYHRGRVGYNVRQTSEGIFLEPMDY